ncbi:Vps54-domain-containing protein [Polyporus arcularius HHB13444]|uniref:Vps54-domain-containing protein n=1 Tax=Polyporus arcularius HHB13444 TaxID=1314778 RepID=A0A5C3PS82_9APHY|nr:Vps54-domain-containing protein [Polyporus arcularius HHB13444]
MSDYASSPSRPASPVGELPSFTASRSYRFNWDNKRPGPGSVSETTEGRADYFAGNVPYDVYNNASLTSLGTLPAEWSSSRHGFNAISNVVNNPHKKSAPPKAHSALPAVPPADLPRVRRKDFDSYLRAVAPEWERFVHNAEQGRDGVAQIEEQLPSSSSASMELPLTPRTPRPPPPGKALPPLETVPPVFFEREFNLGDPRTFAAVTEQREGEEDTDPSSLSHSLPLLEKLSHYADTIEQHLIREISIRSTSFFAALANLQDLQTESEQCLDRISHLRGLLKDVDEKGAKRGLEIVRKEGKLRNMGTVQDGVRFVGSVMEMTGVARSLVGAGQWGEALDMIEELHKLWHLENTPAQPIRPPLNPTKNGRSSPSPLPTVMESPPATPPPLPLSSAPQIPLASLRAFAALPEHLRTLTMEITASLTSEFVNLLRHDLVERIDTNQEGWSEERRQAFNMSLRDRIRPLLQSLIRTKGVLEATLSWREIVMTEVRSTLKRRIPSIELGEDDSIPPQSNGAADLRSMSHSAFLDLARGMYRGYLNCIEGLHRQGAIVIDVVQSIHSPHDPVDITALQEELSDILSSAGELANAHASKVIGIRAEQHTALDLPSFCTLFNESWNFVVKSEVICRRMIVGLRGTIVSQAKAFLQHFHQGQLNQSAKLVEDEQWNAAEVAPTVQRTVDIIVDASISDPPELLLNRPPQDTLSPLPPTSPAPSSPSLMVNGSSSPVQPRPSSPLASPNFPPSPGRSPRKRNTTAPTKHLRVEERAYFAVSATLDVLMLLLDYLKVIVNLPLLTMDTMSRIIELLKSFNSRTCQVVLGAGAMRSAGLKNITAKHLALASQSLAIMISLIPYIRETFRRHLSQKQAVMLIEFDKLKRDYQEHQNEIHAKLIAIMGDRLTAHIRTLQAVRWDVPKQGDGVNEYMEVLVKETVTLHKVLSRYLPSSVVEYVMTQVFAAMNLRLSEEYGKIELPSIEAKERLLADARFLREKLTGLKNVAAPTAMLENVVSEKLISVQQNLPQPTPQHQPVPHAGRFRGMLARTGTLNGRHSTMPAPADTKLPLPNVEKALPPPFSTPSPALSPSPGPDSRAGTPQVDPMADNAPAPVAAPAPVSITEKPLVAEPVESNIAADADVDEPPPQTPPKAEGPSVKDAYAPQENGHGFVTEELNLPPPPSEMDSHPLAESAS